MKTMILLGALILAGCQTGPNFWITHRNYEPRFAIMQYRPANWNRNNPATPEKIAARKAEKDKLMREFCAPEEYRLVSEGADISMAGAITSQVGSGSFTSIIQERQPFIKFACGPRP